MRFLVVLSTLGACAPSPLDPPDFARSLAHVGLEGLPELEDAAGYEESSVNASLADGESTEVWNGEATLQTTAGELTAVGTGVHTRTDDTFRWVDWTVQLTFTDAVIGLHEVDGTLTWDVDENLFESSFVTQRFDGELSVDGELLDVLFVATGSPSVLNEVTGTVDGIDVAWENPSPDVP